MRMKVTERYSVEQLEPLCDNWRMGLGRDTRLDRPVVIAALSLSEAGGAPLDSWLTQRAAVSHRYIAELLDAAQTPTDLVCVFEGGGQSRAGLPNLPREALLSACEKLLNGTEMLWNAGIVFRFSGGQVLWDGVQPRVLGLPLPVGGRLPVGSAGELARDLAAYIGGVLEWSAVVESGAPEGSGVSGSAVWRMGLERLSGNGEARCETLGDVRTVLQAMLMDREAVRSEVESRPQAAGQRPAGSGGPSWADGGGEASRTDGGASPPPFASPSAERPAPSARRVFGEDSEEEVLDGEAPEGRGRMRAVLRAVGLLPTAEEMSPAPPGRPRARTVFLAAGAIAAAGWLGYAITHIRPSSGPGPSTAASHPPSGGSGPAGPSPGHSGAASAPGKPGTGRLAGMPLTLATARLESEGIQAINIAVVAVVRAGGSGTVLSAAPASPSPGSSVTLRVAVAPGDSVVPNLVGLPLSLASSTLLQWHFHYSYVEVNKPSVSPGTVFQQSPGAFTIQPAWSEVRFTAAAHYG